MEDLGGRRYLHCILKTQMDLIQQKRFHWPQAKPGLGIFHLHFSRVPAQNMENGPGEGNDLADFFFSTA